ncbi:MAG: translocation/assembly module TamB domain-containing protein [Prevotella sp.]|nr:translocation/assembly module TamB domain-containing protein [Prevotella sp.]
MKKVFLWIGGILLSPILIFIILSIILYLPPVQDWAVGKATAIASEETGMDVGIEKMRLSFPLDLSIEGVTVVRQPDTIADIRSVVVDVKLLPLIKKTVVIDELEINNAKINTADFIADLQVKGSVGCMAVHSKGIDLDEGTVELNGTMLADADLTIILGDTAAVDTTTSEPLPWLINIDSVSIMQSKIMVHMPGDSMRIGVGMGHATVGKGVIDLLNNSYKVGYLRWDEGSVTYDLPYEPLAPKGMDYNHLAFSNMRLALDSIYFCAPNMAVKISDAALQEQCGLVLKHLSGDITMDSVGIKLPKLNIETPYSNIRARGAFDFSVMDSINPGQLQMGLNASLGKQDLMLFMADMPEQFCKRWPEWPLAVRGDIDGNMEKMFVRELEMTLPTAFSVKAHGSAANITDTERLIAQLDMEAQTYDLGFAMTLADPSIMRDYRIPSGMRMNGIVKADGPRYTANLTAREGKGIVTMKGWFAQNTMSYDADIKIKDLNLHHFMPKQELYEVTASAKAKGYGTDFFKKTSWLEAEAELDHLRFGEMNVDSMKATATLRDGHALASVHGDNELLRGDIAVDALMDTKNVQATLSTDLRRLDLYAMNIMERPLQVGMCGHIDFNSNLDDVYKVSGLIGDIYLRDSLELYRPDDVGITLRTESDTTLFRMQSGDLVIKADASGGYQVLMDQFMALADSMTAQLKERTLKQNVLKAMLPTARLYVNSGRNNPLSNFLRSSADTYFKELAIDMTTSAEKGLNGGMHIYSLNADSTRIDTIRLNMRDSDHGLTYQAQVTNNRRNPQFVFNALIDGFIDKKGSTLGLRFYDDRNMLGLRLGAKATIEDDGLRVNLLPKRPTLGYREFNLNDDNYLFLRQDLKLQAKVNLIADDGTGLKIYSEDQDSTLLQDLTVTLYKMDLDKLTSSIPYVPHISGILDGDYHLMMDKNEKISVASDMQVAKMVYEDCPIGNLSTEFVYMQREDGTHAVQGTMMLDDNEIIELKGSYKNEGPGYIDANLAFIRTPMDIVNGFVPDQLMGLEGYAEGNVSIKGALDKPQVDGEVYLDQAYLVSKPYGVRLRFDDDPVRVINSKLLLENFTMYAHNNNPLNIMGEIDFHDTNRITVDMRMRATNFQLINSKQTKESIAYGKAFVNFYAMMSGRLEQLRMRGKLDVLGTTDVTYLLLDSPLSTDNLLDELVKFTDFSDSTATVVQKPTPDGLKVDMSISIDPGVHVLCGLNVDKTNYVDLLGGGDLNMKYTNDGINMTGRYTISSGSMKYSLPVIPLKTFTIQDGSYVEFTGDMMNPRLNLTATERTKAPVGREGEQSRNVTFDCGVVITKTLNDMGLEFIIDAPEDMSVSSELNAMAKEQRGKLAVTMLTTGMYLADGNTNAFSMNTALSSFLQSEINNITGNALKTMDLSVGLDNSTDATGQTHTDYSFKFAKRFWNNRMKVQIGGKVSSGNEVEGQGQSFFDNVAMEYRITPTSNQYVKLFYNQNVYDWLEGYTGEYGGGYIWKRKLNEFKEIFHIWGNDNSTAIPAVRSTNKVDSIRTNKTDSIRTNNKK